MKTSKKTPQSSTNQQQLNTSNSKNLNAEEKNAMTNKLNKKEITMNNKRIRTRWNLPQSTPENNTGISMTIPDDHLTIQELLDKHTRGEAINQHIYDQDSYFNTEIPVIQDLTDLEDYSQSLKDRHEELEKTIEHSKQNVDKQTLTVPPVETTTESDS
jgi:hypothetical protein